MKCHNLTHLRKSDIRANTNICQSAKSDIRKTQANDRNDQNNAFLSNLQTYGGKR